MRTRWRETLSTLDVSICKQHYVKAAQAFTRTFTGTARVVPQAFVQSLSSNPTRSDKKL
jgi:hypothetical protein